MNREEFKKKTAQLINELADYISKLEESAEEIADEAKEEYRERLDNLKELQKDLSTRFKEYEQLADSKWDVVRESAANFFTSVSQSWKENYAKLRDAFRKEKTSE